MIINKANAAGTFKLDETLLLGIFLGLGTLYDFYTGYRFFDIVIFVMAAITLPYQLYQKHQHFQIKQLLSAQNLKKHYPAALFVAYVILGWFSFRHASSFVMLAMLPFYYLVFNHLKFDTKKMHQIVATILVLHLIFFLAQFIAFYAFNFRLDYIGGTRDLLRQITSSLSFEHMPDSRIMSVKAIGGTLFRPTGLFQEPNNFCSAVVMLCLLIIDQKKYAWIRWLCYVALVISQSMFGFCVAFLLAIYDAMTNKSFKFLVVAIFTLEAALIAGVYLDPIARFENIKADSSMHERLIGLKKANDIGMGAKQAVLDHCQLNSLPFHSFGYGLSSKYFEYCVAKNGISQLIFATGILSPIIAAIFIFALWRRCGWRHSLSIGIGFILMLLCYPLYTYCLFWLWLGIILREKTQMQKSGVL